MDGVLREISISNPSVSMGCFNPCSNGWCTSRSAGVVYWKRHREVSILVLMDGVLRVPEGVKHLRVEEKFQSLF